MSAKVAETSTRRAPVVILYFSGVGGTKVIAELLGRLLAPRIARGCEVHSIEEDRAAEAATRAGFLVLCYPTYFLKPAPAMREFILSLPPGEKGRKVALVTSYELYTGNSNRVAAGLLTSRGFAVTGAYELRAPGTDVTCVVPDWACGWLYRFESRFPEKVAKIAQRIAALVESPPTGARLPLPKWYTPLAWPLQVLFLDGFIRRKDRMKVLGERCSGCDLCVRDCPRGAWRRTGAGLEHRGETCDLCLRCVHHCPRRAIVLKKGLKDNRRLDGALYRALSREAEKACEDAANATKKVRQEQ
ncbi:MAG: EFR1 family ferrodoxin [Spirochaetales bacterium]